MFICVRHDVLIVVFKMRALMSLGHKDFTIITGTEFFLLTLNNAKMGHFQWLGSP